MAVLGEWTGGSTSLLPTTSWAAPNGLFPTQARNDSSTYTFTSSTSTLTLPSTGLADGYLIIGSFEFEDTSNGRHNPQARFQQTGGTGNFFSAQTSGFNRDTSEDRSYVRTWAFIDSPSASATIQFQWRRDSDVPTGGTVRSHVQVIPFYYSNIGMYSSTETGTKSTNTAPDDFGLLAADYQSDTAAIEIDGTPRVTLKTDNKRYLMLGSYYWEGLGNQRTQRWGGFLVDEVYQDAAQGYSYARNTANADVGEMFTWIVDRETTDIDVTIAGWRGPVIGSFPNTGASVTGNTSGVNPLHGLVVIELNDNAKVFRSTGSAQQDIDVAGVRVDLDIASVGDLDFNDSDTFDRASDTQIDVVPATDVLLGANVSGGYASSSSARYTGYSEFTIDGTGQSNSVSGDYGRGDQGSQDCWGWSSNNLSFHAVTAGQNVGVNAGKIAGGEGGTVDTLAGWVGFWGLDLDTLEPPAAGVDIEVPVSDLTLSSEVTEVASGASVSPPVGDLTLSAETPTVVGGTSVEVPVADLTLSAEVPSVASGASVDVPVSDLTLSAETPEVTSVVGPAIVDSTTGSPSITTDVNFASKTGALYEWSGNGSVTFSQGGLVHFLAVAGGASGGGNIEGGGGGGGGVLGGGVTGTLEVSAGTYTIVIGAGGAPQLSRVTGNAGGDTSISGPGITTQTAEGGGGGGASTTEAGAAGGDGGNGGGGGGWATPTGSSNGGTGTQGFDGGAGQNDEGAGGGGAGQAGADSVQDVSAGDGGDGSASSITGTSVTYGGGGGGAANGAASQGTGGSGGGGNGGSSPTAGTDGLGGGGGGGTASAASGAGGTGAFKLFVEVASGVTIDVPVSDLTLSAETPDVAAGASVDVPVSDLTLSAEAPTVSSPTLVYRASEQWTTSNSRTTSSIDIGAADDNRWVIIGVAYEERNSTSQTVTVSSGDTVSTFGTAAGPHASGDWYSRFYKVNVPTGTTITVTVDGNTTNAFWHLAIAVWTQGGGEPTLFDQDESVTQTLSISTTNVDVDDDGAVISMAIANAGDSSGLIFSGVTEDFQANPSRWRAGGSEEGLASETGRVVSFQWPGFVNALAHKTISYTVTSETSIEVPVFDLTLSAEGPDIASGASVDVPVSDLTLDALAPSVSAGAATVEVPVFDLTLEALDPTVIGSVVVQVPVFDLVLSAETPLVGTGATVEVPVANLSLDALAPEVASGASVEVPVLDLTLDILALDVVSGASIDVPVSDLLLQDLAPTVAGGASVDVPVIDLTLDALDPTLFIGQQSVGREAEPSESLSIGVLQNSENRGTVDVSETTGHLDSSLRLGTVDDSCNTGSVDSSLRLGIVEEG